jgi:hypothetical protein
VRLRVATLALATALVAAGPARSACRDPGVTPGYTEHVLSLLRSGTDPLARDGASYDRLARRLPPLRYALGAKGTKLTATGVYYLAFADPKPSRGAPPVLLHVADGSQLIAGRSGGPSVLVSVGGRRFASCDASLAEGWLPILQTRDGAYRQESFTAAVGRTLGAYVRLSGPVASPSAASTASTSSTRAGTGRRWTGSTPPPTSWRSGASRRGGRRDWPKAPRSASPTRA